MDFDEAPKKRKGPGGSESPGARSFSVFEKVGLVPTAAAAATIAAAAATSAAATTAAIATTATAAAATTLFARASFIDRQATAIDLFEVEGLDRGLGLAVVVHFDKAKTFAAARITVLNHGRVLHLAILREELLQALARHGISQITNIQAHAHNTIPSKQDKSAGRTALPR